MKKKFVFLVLISIFISCGCSLNKKYKKVSVPVYRFGDDTVALKDEDSKDIEKKVYIEGVKEYRVKPGDTLSKISREFNAVSYTHLTLPTN